MAKAQQKEADVNNEVKSIDASAAFKIFNTEIAPKNAKQRELSGDVKEPWDRIKDDCNFPKKILVFIHQLEEMEDYKRDHHLNALALGLKERKLFLPSDLVNMANGHGANENVVPFGERKDMGLATLSDGVDADLADDDSDEQETSEAAE